MTLQNTSHSRGLTGAGGAGEWGGRAESGVMWGGALHVTVNNSVPRRQSGGVRVAASACWVFHA